MLKIEVGRVYRWTCLFYKYPIWAEFLATDPRGGGTIVAHSGKDPVHNWVVGNHQDFGVTYDIRAGNDTAYKIELASDYMARAKFQTDLENLLNG